MLGKMEGLIGHAIIPFYIGGTVDMYYFSNHIFPHKSVLQINQSFMRVFLHEN